MTGQHTDEGNKHLSSKDLNQLRVPASNPQRSLDSMTNKNNKRPKLHTMYSSDASRYPTLEKLENSKLPSKSSKMTVEPVLFPIEPNNSTKKSGAQSDSKSIHSVRSSRKNKQPMKAKETSPTDCFAKNLREAVLDADDSTDQGYVYNNNNSNLYPLLLSPPIINFDTSDNYFFSRQKHRRPGLRSTVSELPVRGVKPIYLEAMANKFHSINNFHAKNRYDQYASPSEDDDEEAPLLYHSLTSGRGSKRSRRRLQRTKTSGQRCQQCVLYSVLLISIFILAVILFIFIFASPLKLTQVTSISNVLGTQKHLIFDLHVTASNSNSWPIQISHSAFSVFARSHYVPTLYQPDKNPTLNNARQEYLGTVNKLNDPLLFDPTFVFYLTSKSSNSTSQIQIKDPGETNEDISGNERWSLIIRYPYELTIRGVLKYQVFPSFLARKVYSARICKIVQVDPATGIIKEVPLRERSICDDASR